MDFARRQIRSAVTGLAMSCNSTAHGSDGCAPGGIFSSISRRCLNTLPSG